MKYFVLLIISITTLSCDDSDNGIAPTDGLNGKWIEVKMRTDTLTFESWDDLKIMNLDRGVEFKDGYLLPKPGSGPYQYKLEGEKIALYWMLSSNSNFNHYNFRQAGDSLKIDNFFGSQAGPTLLFTRLR